MARIRTIKPEFSDDEKLAALSRDARLLYVLSWCHSDDFGVVKGNLRWLQSQVFPYDDIESNVFAAWVEELKNIGLFLPFEANNEKYFYIKNFQRHQTIDRPSKTMRNPPPPDDLLDEPSLSPRRTLDEPSTNPRRRLAVGREGKGREKNKTLSDEKDCRTDKSASLGSDHFLDPPPDPEMATPENLRGVCAAAQESFKESFNATHSPKVSGSAQTAKVKKAPDPRVKEFLAYAVQEHEGRTGERLHVDYPKDGVLVKRLLGTYDPEKLKALWLSFLDSDDPWIREAGYSVGVFKAVINKLAVQRRATGELRVVL